MRHRISPALIILMAVMSGAAIEGAHGIESGGSADASRATAPAGAVAQARELDKSGDHAAARTKLETYLASDSADAAEAERVLAGTLRHLEAHADLDRLVAATLARAATHPFRQELLYERAQSLYARGEISAALGEFEASRASKAGSERATHAQFYKGLCLIKLDRWETFEPLAEEFVRDHPTYAKADQLAFYRAMTPYRRRDWSGNRERLETFLKDYPDSALRERAEYNLARALVNGRDTAAAQSFIKARLDAAPTHAHRAGMIFEAGRAEYNGGHWSEATGLFDQALAAAGGNPLIAGSAQVYGGISRQEQARSERAAGREKEGAALEAAGRALLREGLDNGAVSVTNRLHALAWLGERERLVAEAEAWLARPLKAEAEGDPKRAEVLLFKGIGLAGGGEAERTAAAGALDEVLAAWRAGEVDARSGATAAQWRISVAQAAGDEAGARALAREARAALEGEQGLEQAREALDRLAQE